MSIKYRIINDVDHIFDERNNTFLALREIVWGDGDDESSKLDMRRWGVNADGEESPHKGFSFLTEEGPHELARVLVENGYGHTKELLTELSKRDDFNVLAKDVLGGVDNPDFYDPTKEDMFDYNK